MALTKVQNTGIADDAVTTDKIENTTVVAADLATGSVSADKLASTLDLSSKTVTLKNNEISNGELANSAITLNGSSIALGASGTAKHIDWQAVTVADGSTTLAAAAGKGYFLDTNSGVIEVFLPSSPSRGDTIILSDYAGTFATNKIIINTGGKLIDSTVGPDFKVETDNAVVELVFVDANKGWLVKLNQAQGTIDTETYASYVTATGGTVTTSGNFKIHTFTGDSNFVVSSGGNAAGSNAVSYMVVAGGGGSNRDRGGAGGAGGFREAIDASKDSYTDSPLAVQTGLSVSAQTYPITVGAGGAAQCTVPSASNPGSNSVFSTITSAGGGGGGRSPNAAQTGGSGGGGGGNPGAAGNTPPVSPPQGSAGGNGSAFSPPVGNGGGGGATQAGSNGTSGSGGDGGDGAQTSINATATYYAGGGGGGHDGSSKGCGGQGGGGNGANGPYPGSSVAAQDGTANTGGGAGSSNGGGDSVVAKSGGKGVVVIRYKYQN